MTKKKNVGLMIKWWINALKFKYIKIKSYFNCEKTLDLNTEPDIKANNFAADEKGASLKTRL